MPEVPCAFHPDRLTAVSCSNCGRPICPADMIPAPVGYQCPVCTGRAREGSFGAASYRTREAVSQRVDRLPMARLIRRAGATQTLLALNVAAFVAMLFTIRQLAPTGGHPYGAMPPVFPKSEWWRLFTAMFVHFGPVHLLFNMWALMIFGPAIEGRYGKARFFALYFAAGLLADGFSLSFGRLGIRAGASGAVFGILGAWIAFFVRHRKARGASDQLRSLFFLVGINLFLGYTVVNVDNWAHIGGLVGGFVAGMGLEQWGKRRGRLGLVIGAGAYLAVVIAAIALVSSSRILL
jgi:membrane associated rhomboid family serine protease